MNCPKCESDYKIDFNKLKGDRRITIFPFMNFIELSKKAGIPVSDVTIQNFGMNQRFIDVECPVCHAVNTLHTVIRAFEVAKVPNSPEEAEFYNLTEEEKQK